MEGIRNQDPNWLRRAMRDRMIRLRKRREAAEKFRILEEVKAALARAETGEVSGVIIQFF